MTSVVVDRGIARRPAPLTDRWRLLPLALLAVSRGGLVAAGTWAVLNLPFKAGDGTWTDWQDPPAAWIRALSRWDSRWYFYIAHDGYTYRAGEQSDVVFAPLFPTLMRVVGGAFGRTDKEGLLLAGIVVANLALAAAVVYLGLLVGRAWGRGMAIRAISCLLLFPTTLFLSAAYADSLFLAAALAAFVYAAEDRWWAVGVCGALAALARGYGVLIAVPLAYEYLYRARWRLRPDAGWLALIPAAFLAWTAYLWALSGDPLVLLHAERQWGHELAPPWQTLGRYLSGPLTWTNPQRSPLDLAAGGLLLVLVALSWRLPRRSLGLYATVLMLPLVWNGTLVSIPRYGLELFPIFIVLAQLTRFWPVLVAYAAAAGGLAVYVAVRFAAGFWVA